MPPIYIVVDACVASAWSFAEPYSLQAQRVLEAIVKNRVNAWAPERFVDEVLRVCQKKTLPPPGGVSMSAADAYEHFEDVVTLPIVLMPCEELRESAWNLAITTPKLTTHDALYLALARDWGAELWTLDAGLASTSAIYPFVHDLRTTAFPY